MSETFTYLKELHSEPSQFQNNISSFLNKQAIEGKSAAATTSAAASLALSQNKKTTSYRCNKVPVKVQPAPVVPISSSVSVFDSGCSTQNANTSIKKKKVVGIKKSPKASRKTKASKAKEALSHDSHNTLEPFSPNQSLFFSTDFDMYQGSMLEINNSENSLWGGPRRSYLGNEDNSMLWHGDIMPDADVSILQYHNNVPTDSTHGNTTGRNDNTSSDVDVQLFLNNDSHMENYKVNYSEDSLNVLLSGDNNSTFSMFDYSTNSLL
jgi:hypothetical protein